MSASSTAAGSVILVSDASPIGSPTASTSTTSLTEVGRAPIRDSINSAKPGGTTGSPSHRQTPCCRTSRPCGDLLLHNVAQIQHIAAGQLPQPDRGSRIQGSAQRRRQQRVGFVA